MDNEALEAEADAILRRSDDVLVAEMKQHADALIACYEEALGPRNDRDYVLALQQHDRDRIQIGNDLAKAHLFRDGRKYWLGLLLRKPRDRARAQELLRLVGEHFEIQAVNHDEDRSP